MAEGKQLINDISGLIYEMRHDRDLSPLQGASFSSSTPSPHQDLLNLLTSAATGLPDDTAAYNDELAQLAEKGENKWFSAPWLFAECVSLAPLLETGGLAWVAHSGRSLYSTSTAD